MITRAQYMSGEKTHDEYYSQFVTRVIKQIVLGRFTIKQLKEAYAEDKHFNSIRLSDWDAMSIARNSSLESKLCEAGDTVSLSSYICIFKQAARQIVVDNQT